MKPLDLMKEKFNLLFPVEDNVRENRFALAGYKCEFCGGNNKLEHHHICSGKLRRTPFERIFSTRIVCASCHKLERKGQMIAKFRKELAKDLQKWFTNEEIRVIIGKDNLF